MDDEDMILAKELGKAGALGGRVGGRWGGVDGRLGGSLSSLVLPKNIGEVDLVLPLPFDDAIRHVRSQLDDELVRFLS